MIRSFIFIKKSSLVESEPPLRNFAKLSQAVFNFS